MGWRDEVVADVGRDMGVEGLNFAGSGVISLEFENSGALYLEQKADGVLMYLIRTVSRFDSGKQLMEALRQCHFTRSMQFPLQVGLKGDDQLFFIIFLVNEEFTKPNVLSVMDVLTRQFEAIDNR
ncbi:MAG: hypothetical protein ACR2PT_12530 [Endozoicomonas sp.]